MKIPNLRLLLIAMAIALPILSKAQFLIGYSYGFMPAYELNRDIYEYNVVNGSGLSKEMKPVRYVHSPVIGFRLPIDKGYFELVWNRKSKVTTSAFDSAGVPFQRQMKVWTNTFNWGFGFGKDKLHFGLSFDFGFCRVKGKRGPTDGFKDLDWTPLASPPKFLLLINRMLPDANTAWIEYDITDFLTARIYAQMFWFKTELDVTDSQGNQLQSVENWLFGENLNWALGSSDRFNNYGVSLYFKIGK